MTAERDRMIRALTETVDAFLALLRAEMTPDAKSDAPAPPPAERGAEPWLRVPQAVDYSRRSKSVIIGALQDGSLRGSQTKRGGTWTIHRDDLDAWIRGKVADVQPARVARRPDE